MNQNKPQAKAKEVRTLSIRIPMSLYLSVSQYGIDKDLPSLNAAVIALMEAGMDTSSDRDAILSAFIQEIVSPEQLKEIINGKQ